MKNIKIKHKILVSCLILALIVGLIMLTMMSAFAASGEKKGAVTNYQRAVIAWSYTNDVKTMKTSVTVQLKVLNASDSQASTEKSNAPYHIQLTSNTSGSPTEKDGKFDYKVAGKGKNRTITGAKITNSLKRTSGATKKVNFSGYINLSPTQAGKLSVSSSITLPAITKPTTSAKGTITWSDDNNRDGVRPTSVTATCNNGGGSKSVAASAGSVTFSGLPQYNASGTAISYAISWSTPSGYTQKKTGNNVTYTHTPARTSHSCTVKWEDDNNRDGLRPSSVSVQLLKNGAANSTASATAAGSWACTFSNLYKNESGKVIAWTNKAVAPTGYTANGTTLTHTPERKNIEGNITWTDSNDHAGYRPQKITVTLLKNGEKKASVETDATKGWAFSFADQYVYESGAEIKYTISVPEVDTYKRVVSGTNVTYTYFPGFDIRFGFSI